MSWIEIIGEPAHDDHPLNVALDPRAVLLYTVKQSKYGGTHELNLILLGGGTLSVRVSKEEADRVTTEIRAIQAQRAGATSIWEILRQ